MVITPFRRVLQQTPIVRRTDSLLAVRQRMTSFSCFNIENQIKIIIL